jgi:MinD superfamily P-loop ATPase
MIKIAVASGKGGTGKTLVATNMFHTLLGKNEDVLLVDCDAEAPNAVAFFETSKSGSLEVNMMVPVIDTDKCIYCGKCHDYCNYNAIFIIPPMQIIKVLEDLCHGCGACSVACDYEAVSEKPVPLGIVSSFDIDGQRRIIESRMNTGVMSPVAVILSAIKLAGDSSPVVIFDSPPGTSCPFIQTVARADYVILVTEPTPFGLSDLKQSVDTLRKINKPCGVIINRSGLGNSDVKDYLNRENIPILMEIPFSKEIAGLYSQGEIASVKIPSLGDDFCRVARDLINHNGNSSN